ncbi:MAG: asparagine synthase (glutamine-hydrolyzing) [Betaproteobacteria bacterium]|nr:asparagine synthase (glutamine-hydrolyzing) [Betaproteobacteria bacterium]
MCGILALVSTPWQHCAERALGALHARGPDARTLWRHEDATLGHTRLSVIDLDGGAQPMASDDGRLVLAYNGEIYNFRELRRELETCGHVFRTRSDTEVILRGWLQWGRDLVPRLDGMFAFALWDKDERVLFAARDRLGIKPLFWSAHRGLSLASTLAPFFALEGFPRTLDAEALRDYLAFQTPLAPHSFLKDVRQLPPAHSLTWRAADGAVRVEQYWHIPPAVPERQAATGSQDRLAQLDGLLRDTVAHQLVSDVPLGAFLSGGIDSSLIVHYMAQAGARPLLTFSVRFNEEGYDESPAALAVARRYGAEHHVIEAPAIGADELARALAAQDQPLADPAYIPTFELAQITRRHVTVALSGDGGDELFGGYERFLDTEDRHPDTATRRALRAALRRGLAPGSATRRSLAGRELLFYRRVELGPWPRTRKSLAHYLTAGALAACHPADTLGRWRELAAGFGPHIDTAALMRADLWTYLSENCLVKTDRASMAHGLEVRVPLLGNALMDFALAQPAHSHTRPHTKAMLGALAREKLPMEVWNRPKHGFSVPLLQYFRGPWRDLCEHAVARAGDVAPFLRPDAVAALWRAALAGRGSRRLAYTFIVLLLWLERQRVSLA